MKRTTRQFIRGLRKTFRETDTQGRKEIWDILTGLRGPDYEGNSWTDKRATTAVIRSEVFGIKNLMDVPADVSGDCDNSVAIRSNSTFSDHSHFKFHAQSAFKALGLKWDEVNE